MKTMLIIAAIALCFFECESKRDSNYLVYRNSTYIDPYCRCAQTCDEMTVRNNNNNKTSTIVINECDYNRDTLTFFSFQCNETHFWYLQSTDNSCSNNNDYFLFDSSIYSVITCDNVSSISGDNNNQMSTTATPATVPNDFNLSIIDTNNTNISIINNNCLTNLNNIYNICLEINSSLHYHCSHEPNMDVQCQLLNSTSNSLCNKVSTYNITNNNFTSALNQTLGILSCSLELNYQFNSTNITNDTCLLRANTNLNNIIWNCLLLSVPASNVTAPFNATSQILVSTTSQIPATTTTSQIPVSTSTTQVPPIILTTQISPAVNTTQISQITNITNITNILSKNPIIKVFNKRRLKLVGIPILIGIILLVCCCIPLCCMIPVFCRNRDENETKDCDEEETRGMLKTKPRKQAIQSRRDSSQQRRAKKIETTEAEIKNDEIVIINDKNNKNRTPDGDSVVYV